MAQAFRKLKFLLGRLPRLPGADQKQVLNHARYRGIQHYDFTKDEHAVLRNLALQLKLKQELVAELDRDFRFMHECPRLMRTGRFNSITGVCYDIAVRNYAEAAAAIEKAYWEYIEPDGNIGSRPY